MKKVMIGLAIVLLVMVAGFAAFVASRQHLTFDAPMPAVAATADSAVVERGRYLVHVLANCAVCHADPAQAAQAAAGVEVPLSGGYEFNIPLGKIHPPNITPDAATGIGGMTDGQVARALRYGVGHDGRALLPFMEMQGLSDEDLVALVSYLRSQPPVRHEVTAHEYTLLGKVVKATALAKPMGPRATPPAANPHGATVENGRYLVESVANCWACHTQRDFKTGKLTGAHLAGGSMPDDHNPKRMWNAPNLTSDPETGRMGMYDEDGFVERMRGGRVIEGSPMPWEAFQRIQEDDLRAMYRYLVTVPKVVNEMGAPFTDRE